MSRGLGQFLLFCSHCINIAHLLQVSRLCGGALWLHFLRAYIGPPQKAKDCMKVKVKALIILFAVISIWQKAKEWIFGLLKGKWSKLFSLLIFFNIPQRNKIFQIFLAINLRSHQIFQVRITWLQKARRGLEEKKEDKDKEARWRTAAARERMVGKRSIGVPTSCTVRGRTCTVRLSLSHREILQESWGSSWITQGKGKRSVKH